MKLIYEKYTEHGEDILVGHLRPQYQFIEQDGVDIVNFKIKFEKIGKLCVKLSENLIRD